MRVAKRLLASVKPERFLEAGNPTGLTGLLTHSAPRAALLFNYKFTLDILNTLPEHSVYRQAAEAVTRHRLKIVESIQPPGLKEWQEKVAEREKRAEADAKEMAKENNKEGSEVSDARKPGARQSYTSIFNRKEDVEIDDEEEWNGESVYDGSLEGYRTSAERNSHMSKRETQLESEVPIINFEDHEPPLEASQIAEIENQIGGGLIEEVIQVSEGEMQLATVMVEAKVWDELAEKAPSGQWEYFARDQHTSGTQEPPK